MVLVLMLAKPVFMLYHYALHPFTAGDVMQVVAHGMTLDLSTALYLIIVPFLVILLSIWLWSWNGLYRLLKGYYVIAAIVLALAFVADTSLYEFWGFKLDASVLPYLSTPKEAFASVSVWYLLLRFFIIILVAFIIYKILVWLTPVQRERRRGISQIGYSRGRTQRGHFFISPVKQSRVRLISTIIGLLLIPLFVIGMRGGTSVSTSNVGQAYFSQNQFLNHSAVNPVFSFLSSFGKTATAVKTNKDEKGEYEYFSKKELKKRLDGIFDTQSVDPDTLLTTQRPNVVLIIMEGCGSIFTEANGNGHVTPNLTKLMNEGLYFTSCVANSWRTDRGMVSILSGYPAFPDKSVMKMAQKCETLPSIARTLKENGYSTTFLYGGDANFTNTRGYLTSTGFEKIISEDGFTKKERGDSKWGVNDWVVFGRLLDIVKENADKKKEDGTAQPWFTTMLTLSSHEPWTVPMKKKFDDPIFNAFYFLDICLGDFVNKLKNTPAWENTLVVILPDHSVQYQDIDQTKPMRHLIPMIWTGGAVKTAKHVGQACNQTDLPATLFGQMGIKHDDFTFSRDIFSKTYQRQFAMTNWTEGFATFDASGFNAYSLKSQQVIAGKAGDAIEIGKAILQVTDEDLRQR
jgi:phosphoglycerol transferase MdoB-like AlkP superfamily enzyme